MGDARSKGNIDFLKLSDGNSGVLYIIIYTA